jgi:hypothetical protein
MLACSTSFFTTNFFSFRTYDCGDNGRTTDTRLRDYGLRQKFRIKADTDLNGEERNINIIV